MRDNSFQVLKDKIAVECSKGGKVITEECAKLMQECRRNYPGNRLCPDGSMINDTNLTTDLSVQDETSEWKTYTNTQYGFELKYPNNYVLTEDKNRVSIKSSPDCILSEGMVWPKNCFSYDLLIQNNEILISGTGVSKTKINVAGYMGEKTEDENQGMWTDLIQTTVQFSRNNKWYINYISFNLGNKIEAENLFDRILSTFKFTK